MAEIDEAYVLLAARTAGLELAPAHAPGVTEYFRMIAGIASAVNEFPLSDDTESAAVFTPCSPPTRE